MWGVLGGGWVRLRLIALIFGTIGVDCGNIAGFLFCLDYFLCQDAVLFLYSCCWTVRWDNSVVDGV